MPTSTYEPIATYTVTGSNLSGLTGVTFNSFSGYTDLKLVFDGSLTAAAITCLQFNGSGGTAYSWTWLGGNGSAASTNRGANQPQTFLTNVAHMTSSRGNIIVDIMNYANTTTNKVVLSRANNGGGLGVDATVGLWRSTSAITSLQIYLDRAESFVVGSTFTLYGIKAA